MRKSPEELRRYGRLLKLLPFLLGSPLTDKKYITELGVIYILFNTHKFDKILFVRVIILGSAFLLFHNH